MDRDEVLDNCGRVDVAAHQALILSNENGGVLGALTSQGYQESCCSNFYYGFMLVLESLNNSVWRQRSVASDEPVFLFLAFE